VGCRCILNDDILLKSLQGGRNEAVVAEKRFLSGDLHPHHMQSAGVDPVNHVRNLKVKAVQVVSRAGGKNQARAF